MLRNFITSIASGCSGSVHTASQASGSASSSEDVYDDAAYTQLNEYLELLCEVFPEADVEDLRHRLRNSSDESRLYLVTESLLKNPAGGARRNAKHKIDPSEKFRSTEYQRTVRALLQQEFKGLSKSTIHAVMVENNHDYRKSRTTLAEIAAKSWRFSVSGFFRRKKTEVRSSAVELRLTGCDELDAELRELGAEKIQAQIAEDRRMAGLLDEAEHAAASELVECETCYSDYSWNEIAACSEGHFICYKCLIRSVQESLYGQGQCIVGEKSSIKCLSAAASPGCQACIPPEILAKVLPDDLHQAMEDKAATENLDRSGLGLVRCPFCSYAEVDEIRPYQFKQSAKISGMIIFFFFCILAPVSQAIFIALTFPFIYLLRFILKRESSAALLGFMNALSSHAQWDQAVRRVQLKRRGTLFRCQNPRCKRESCIQCYKEWTPFHKCFEKEEDGVRLHVERAMANAVKRTCPMCRVSFVKDSGCNKLTCVCGYIMCYVCRADIRKEGYRHFCQHFRQVPGTPCTECNNCDLYVQEDEDAAIRQAAELAEEEYFRNHDVPPTWKYRSKKIAGTKICGKPGQIPLIDTRQVEFYLDKLIAAVIEDA